MKRQQNYFIRSKCKQCQMDEKERERGLHTFSLPTNFPQSVFFFCFVLNVDKTAGGQHSHHNPTCETIQLSQSSVECNFRHSLVFKQLDQIFYKLITCHHLTTKILYHQTWSWHFVLSSRVRKCCSIGGLMQLPSNSCKPTIFLAFLSQIATLSPSGAWTCVSTSLMEEVPKRKFIYISKIIT